MTLRLTDDQFRRLTKPRPAARTKRPARKLRPRMPVVLERPKPEPKQETEE